jgi:hypothetical protein
VVPLPQVTLSHGGGLTDSPVNAASEARTQTVHTDTVPRSTLSSDNALQSVSGEH